MFSAGKPGAEEAQKYLKQQQAGARRHNSSGFLCVEHHFLDGVHVRQNRTAWSIYSTA